MFKLFDDCALPIEKVDWKDMVPKPEIDPESPRVGDKDTKCEKTYIPVVDKNCERCKGTGVIHLHHDSDSGGIPHPCECVRYREEDGDILYAADEITG